MREYVSRSGPAQPRQPRELSPRSGFLHVHEITKNLGAEIIDLLDFLSPWNNSQCHAMFM
jgi:hypothetical protein